MKNIANSGARSAGQAYVKNTVIGLLSITMYYHYGPLLFQAYQSACNAVISPCTVAHMSNLGLGRLVFSPFAAVANILFATIARRGVTSLKRVMKRQANPHA